MSKEMSKEITNTWSSRKLKEKIKDIREKLEDHSSVVPYPGWKVKIYSEILEEAFILYEDGRIVFSSGIEYKEEEWRSLKGLSRTELRAVHNTKSVFPESKVIERKVNQSPNQLSFATYESAVKS